jgi:hypothetical protein
MPFTLYIYLGDGKDKKHRVPLPNYLFGHVGSISLYPVLNLYYLLIFMRPGNLIHHSIISHWIQIQGS